jgi:ubiquinone/menaquinone biosynthesis C-methylase UbiE
MNDSIKVFSEIEVLTSNIDFHSKVIIDVGCGFGKLTRILSNHCKYIYGIDLPEIIAKAKIEEPLYNVQFKTGIGQDLPFNNNFADIIIFFTSFHHIPENEMSNTIKECFRVLKSRGRLCFVEPVARENSYYEMLRTIDDEAEIQKQAYQIIKRADLNNFSHVTEANFYLERSYKDFENLVNQYVNEEQNKSEILENAKEIIMKKNVALEKVKFKSYCRLNLLEKKVY